LLPQNKVNMIKECFKNKVITVAILNCHLIKNTVYINVAVSFQKKIITCCIALYKAFFFYEKG